MSETYEEWEVEATRGKRKWRVSDALLPRCGKEGAQAMCDTWHEMSPDIEYKPVGYRVTRTKIIEGAK